jgi:hypothetical protein
MNETATGVECPGCGLVREVDRFRRTAGEFCTRCDYPLFFAPVAADRQRAEVGSPSEVEEALRRLPGDRHRLAATRCPACGERNPANGVRCLRCDADLHPPVEPAVPEPAPAPPPVAGPEPRPWLTPALVAALVAAVLLVGVLVAVLR